MSPEEQDILAEKIAGLISQSQTTQCNAMHTSLVEKFEKALNDSHETFKEKMSDMRNDVYEKGTGYEWKDREKVKGGIWFAVMGRAIAWKATLVLVGVLVVAGAAYIGLG